MLVEWGGIVGIYSNGGKSRQKHEITLMETTCRLRLQNLNLKENLMNAEAKFGFPENSSWEALLRFFQFMKI